MLAIFVTIEPLSLMAFSFENRYDSKGKGWSPSPYRFKARFYGPSFLRTGITCLFVHTQMETDPLLVGARSGCTITLCD